MYDVEKIIYWLAGLFVFGNTCLLIGFVMTIEDRKNEKRKRRIKRKAKRKAKRKVKAKAKPKKKDEPIIKFTEEDDIIIEEFDD